MKKNQYTFILAFFLLFLLFGCGKKSALNQAETGNLSLAYPNSEYMVKINQGTTFTPPLSQK